MAIKKDQWLDISAEQFREYVYADFTLKVILPKRITISRSSLGGQSHRIETEDGQAYYIPTGWKAIRWQVKEGRSLFSF